MHQEEHEVSYVALPKEKRKEVKAIEVYGVSI